jgi:hypothetical protein
MRTENREQYFYQRGVHSLVSTSDPIQFPLYLTEGFHKVCEACEQGILTPAPWGGKRNFGGIGGRQSRPPIPPSPYFVKAVYPT